MDIPRNDMLPDPSQTDQDISEDVKPQVPPKVEVHEDEPQETEATPPVESSPKVVKTPENELLAALKEERNKRKILEEKVKELESSSVTSEFLDEDSLSIEGKLLKKQLDAVNTKLATLEKEKEEERIYAKYPQLKDKQEEFDEFRESKSYSFEDAAEVFIAKNNLLADVKPARKGLEKPTGGGDKRAEPSGFSASDVDRLMKTQPRKFIEMVRSGKIKAEDIK